MWWLIIDPDSTSTRFSNGEEVDLTYFIDNDVSQLRLDQDMPVAAGSELWIYQRQFRLASGLAHTVGAPYKLRTRWWLDVKVDLAATSKLRAKPLHGSGRRLVEEPWGLEPPDPDPWLVKMDPADLRTMRSYLAGL